MKRISLILILFVAFCANCFSQSKITAGVTTIKKTVTVEAPPVRSTGPVINLGIGLGPVIFPSADILDKYSGVNLHCGVGYQINPRFYTGLSIGVTGTSYYSGYAVPILFEARSYFSENAKSSFFVELGAGYNPVGVKESERVARSDGMMMIDKGVVFGFGPGWSGAKFSIKMKMEYNNSFSSISCHNESLLFIGWHFDYYIRPSKH